MTCTAVTTSSPPCLSPLASDWLEWWAGTRAFVLYRIEASAT